MGGRIGPGRPVCLTIGGSDSCGGAGIQADLRIFAQTGVRGCSAITALTAQNPREITRIEPVPLAQLDAELHAIFDHYDVIAVKTGMLVDAEHVAVVAAALEQRKPRHLVVDPVMLASSGAELLDTGGREALRQALLPLASLITPNLEEAACWLDCEIDDMRTAAASLAQSFGTAVLLKGGHGAGDVVRDVLAEPGRDPEIFEHPRHNLDEEQAHGTGCRLAAAIASHLAQGKPLHQAVAQGVAGFFIQK